MPGSAGPDRDRQRHLHLDGVAHLVADEFGELLEFPVGHFEDQFVVHLEQHAAAQ